MAASPQHVTLVAATVSTLTFDDDFTEVEAIYVAGTAAVYFTLDGSTPTVGGAGTHVLAPVVGGSIRRKPNKAGDTVVKLISSGTPSVSVRGTVNDQGKAI